MLCVPMGTTSVSPSCVTYTGWVVTHSAVLSWNASTSPGVVGYYVSRATASEVQYTQITPGLINALTWTDPTIVEFDDLLLRYQRGEQQRPR